MELLLITTIVSTFLYAANYFIKKRRRPNLEIIINAEAKMITLLEYVLALETKINDLESEAKTQRKRALIKKSKSLKTTRDIYSELETIRSEAFNVKSREAKDVYKAAIVHYRHAIHYNLP